MTPASTLGAMAKTWASEDPHALATVDRDGQRVSYTEMVDAAEARSLRLRPAAGATDVPVTERPRAEDAVTLLAGVLRSAIVPRAPWDGARLSYADASSREATQRADARYVDPPAIAWWIRTSGTTGPPKWAGLTHAAVIESARSIADLLRLQRTDAALALAPLYLSTGLTSWSTSLVSGGASIFPDSPDPRQWAEAAIEHGATWATAPTSILAGLLIGLDEIGAREGDVKLRLVRCVSATPPRSLREGFEERYGVAVVSSYGMTECINVASQDPTSPHRGRHGSGVPRGVRVRIVDDAGREVHRGETGTITIASASRIALAGDPVDGPAYESRLGDSRTLVTSDIGRWDDDGELSIVGRTSDVIDRGGTKIAPLDVERVLESHPAVDVAIAFAVEHPTMGSDLVAAVRLRDGSNTTRQEIRDHAIASLRQTHVPSLIVCTSNIPRLHGGKLDRHGAATRLGDDLVAAFVPTRSTMELLWAQAVASVLRTDDVGRDTNFFSIGGDSLSAIIVADALSARLGRSIEVASMFRWPTARTWAEALVLEPTTREAETP